MPTQQEEVDNGTALEWYLSKNESEKTNLRYKYFENIYIPYSNQWGFHFTFGQLKEMYLKENLITKSNDKPNN